MTDERLCDKPDCLQPAKIMVAIRYGKHVGLGYWSCDLHEAEAFWQVTKIGLEQHERFTIVLLDQDQVEDRGISRP